MQKFKRNISNLIISLHQLWRSGSRSLEGKRGDGTCLRLSSRFPESDLWTTSETCCGGSELAERRLLRPRPVAHIPLGLSLPSLDKNYIIAACDLILLKEHFEVSFPLFTVFTLSLSHSLCNVQIAHIKSPPFSPPSFPPLLPHLVLFLSFLLSYLFLHS